MGDLGHFVSTPKRPPAGRNGCNPLIHKGEHFVSFVSASLNRGFEFSLSLSLWVPICMSIYRKPTDETDKAPRGCFIAGDSLTGCTDDREHRQDVPSNNIDQR